MANKIDDHLDLFRQVVRESCSISEVLRKMGYKVSGGASQFFKKKARQYKVDYSHFSGKGWAKGESRDSSSAIDQVARLIERPWKEIFCKNSTYSNNQQMVKKLIRVGKKEYKCEECGISEWKGKKIVLNLHHKNGDHCDNREINLQFLCPNCHSQTGNFSHKN